MPNLNLRSRNTRYICFIAVFLLCSLLSGAFVLLNGSANSPLSLAVGILSLIVVITELLMLSFSLFCNTLIQAGDFERLRKACEH
jgi:hypothetical protein